MMSQYRKVRELFTITAQTYTYTLSQLPTSVMPITALLANRVQTHFTRADKVITLTGFNNSVLPVGKQLTITYFVEVI